MNHKFTYLEMYKGKLLVKQTNSFNKLLINTYKGSDNYSIIDFFDDENSNIKLIYSNVYKLFGSSTLIYKLNGKVFDSYKGELIFIKLINNKFVSLSNEDINFIKDKIDKKLDGTFVYNTFINFNGLTIKDYILSNNKVSAQ